jgi:hypothetical protein
VQRSPLPPVPPPLLLASSPRVAGHPSVINHHWHIQPQKFIPKILLPRKLKQETQRAPPKKMHAGVNALLIVNTAAKHRHITLSTKNTHWSLLDSTPSVPKWVKFWFCSKLN